MPSGVAVDPSGAYVYVCNQAGASIARFAFDPGTGQLTALGTVPVGAAPQFLLMGVLPQ
jgi:6-phosphogluconolactonase (cycloisomerase 2 family)